MSSVSQQHADHILRIRPDLQFSCIEQQINVFLVSPWVLLKAIGFMHISILFDNGRSETFSMLAVSDLSWPVPFGLNHLHMTNAHLQSL